jgi:hypothetical protein
MEVVAAPDAITVGTNIGLCDNLNLLFCEFSSDRRAVQEKLQVGSKMILLVKQAAICGGFF